MSWDPEAISPLTGKTIIVTGTTSGTGLETARYLYRHGATVIMASRNQSKLSKVSNDFLTEEPASSTPGSLHSLVVDTSDLDSVRSFVSAFEALGLPELHALVLNAGVNLKDYLISPQGFEMNFATNHLGHWLMTGMLMPYLKRGKGRVVSVSSLAHRMLKKPMEYDILLGKTSEGFNRWDIYGESKLANVLFVTELNRRLKAQGIDDVIAVGSHPGAAKTNLMTDEIKEMNWLMLQGMKLLMLFGQEAIDGAKPIMMATVDETATGNDFYGPGGFFEFSGKPQKGCVIGDAAKDEEAMKKLWSVSEEATGFKYIF